MGCEEVTRQIKGVRGRYEAGIGVRQVQGR